jgi:hypothetical protein
VQLLVHRHQLEWSEAITLFYAIGGGIHHADVGCEPAVKTLLIKTFAGARTKSLGRQ